MTEAEASSEVTSSASEGLGHGAKSHWIRSQPIDEKVSALRARARAEGIEISENLVYSVRKAMKAGTTSVAPKPSRPTLAAAAPIVNGHSGKLAVAAKHPSVDDAVQKKNIRALQAAILMNGIALSEQVFTEMKQAYYP